MQAPPPLSEPAIVQATGRIERFIRRLFGNRSVVLQPEQIGGVRIHKTKMKAVTVAAVTGVLERVRVAPAVGLDVPIGKGQRAAGIMFDRRPMPEPAGAVD